VVCLAYAMFSSESTTAADYNKIFSEAMERSFKAESYRFFSKSTLFIGEEKREFSIIEGTKSGPQNRHAQGNMLGTPVNIYALGQTVYRQDPLTGRWQTLSPAEIPDTLLLLDELFPSVNFKFSNIGEVQFLGKEKLDGRNCLKLHFSPVMEDEWINRYFHNITYTVWLYGRNPHIIKAVITGISKENTSVSLTIESHFTDFGKEIKLAPPVI